jgi:hypothetical protein
VGPRLGGLAIGRLFSSPDGRVKGSRRFGAEATLACCVLFSCCRSNEVLRRTHGKDNRVLYTAKLPQGFKVVSPSRAWQGAGISTGGTKISVTGSETRTAKLRFEQGEATVMSKQKNCGGVLPASGFRSSTGNRGANLRPPWARCHLTVLLLNSSAALKSGLSLHVGDNSVRTDPSNQIVGRK